MRFMTIAGLVAAGALMMAILLVGVVPASLTPTRVEMGAALAPMAAATTAPQPLATANPAGAPRTNPNIATDPKTNPNIASDPETNPNIAGDTTGLLAMAVLLGALAFGLGAALAGRRRAVGTGLGTAAQ